MKRFLHHSPGKSARSRQHKNSIFQCSWHVIKSYKKLCQRLKTILVKLILETQSTFVSNRLIYYSILIVHGIFHGLRNNNPCKGKFMAIKTYMNKAYDRVK